MGLLVKKLSSFSQQIQPIWLPNVVSITYSKQFLFFNFFLNCSVNTSNNSLRNREMKGGMGCS